MSVKKCESDSTSSSNHSVGFNAVLNVIKQSSTILFPLIIYPYISRVLGSDCFGRISFSSSIVEYGMVIAVLGIPTYIVREGAKARNNKETLYKLASEVFTINFIAMMISIILIGASVMIIPRLKVEILTIGILSLNIVFYFIGREWLNTIFEDYLYITIRYIVFKTISLFLIFFFVKKPEHYLRYAFIMVFSETGGCIANVFYNKKYCPMALTLHINFKRHIKPILLLFCSTVAVKIYIQSDITFIGFLRSDSEVGIYSLASKIYSVIKSVLNAIIFVAIPRISFFIGNDEREKYNALLEKLRDSLIILLYPCIIGSLCLGRNIILIMGGEAYESGYVAFDILCIALLFAVFGCYYAQGILITNNKEGTFFLITSFSAILNILLNFIAVRYYGIEGAAVTTLISEIVIMFSSRFYTKSLVKKDPVNKDEKNNLGLSVLFGCVAIMLVCILVSYLQIDIIIQTFLSVVLSMIVYFAVLYFFKVSLLYDGFHYCLSKIRK